MDEDNIDELNRKSPKDGTAKIELLGKYDPEGDIIIRDPYYVTISFLSFCDFRPKEKTENYMRIIFSLFRIAAEKDL